MVCFKTEIALNAPRSLCVPPATGDRTQTRGHLSISSERSCRSRTGSRCLRSCSRPLARRAFRYRSSSRPDARQPRRSVLTTHPTPASSSPEPNRSLRVAWISLFAPPAPATPIVPMAQRSRPGPRSARVRAGSRVSASLVSLAINASWAARNSVSRVAAPVLGSPAVCLSDGSKMA